MQEKSSHIVFIDSLRGIAAFVVMAFHFVFFIYENEPLFTNQVLKDVMSHGVLGVQLFYIISAFVIVLSFRRANYSINNYGKYMLKRIIRIHPTYILVIVGILLLQIIHNKGISSLPAWQNILANITYTVEVIPGNTYFDWINPIFATLAVEFVFYIAIGLLYPFIDSSKWIRFSFLISTLVIAYYCNRFFHLESATLYNLPYFILGYFLLDVYQDRDRNWGAVGILLVLLFIMNFYPSNHFVLAIAVVPIFLFLKPSFGISNFIGRISYSLYLSHGLFGGTFLYLSTKITWLWEHPIVSILIAFTISIGGAFVLHKWVEKPSMKMGRRIRY